MWKFNVDVHFLVVYFLFLHLLPRSFGQRMRRFRLPHSLIVPHYYTKFFPKDKRNEGEFDLSQPSKYLSTSFQLNDSLFSQISIWIRLGTERLQWKWLVFMFLYWSLRPLSLPLFMPLHCNFCKFCLRSVQWRLWTLLLLKLKVGFSFFPFFSCGVFLFGHLLLLIWLFLLVWWCISDWKWKWNWLEGSRVLIIFRGKLSKPYVWLIISPPYDWSFGMEKIWDGQ